ncbi:uncharacterized protein N0V89_001029 [Didymosphaeria variabile]|uniref:Rhodopsin domain-containing protein n=1 Tax=Didymosphaeria variabile TaxID=1932322 RepID=A0A9W8XW97_9PLEO|nr:uncharacterized protein N0V89_001029 [Didymosphaeria variabile]KAJ4360466.1 hypothetical protein N0V89_001029 [Didymosphaeria variabile]
MFVASHAGLGQHVALLSADAVKSALLYSNILDIMYTPIMLAAKVSILVQVDRMFSGNKQRMIFWSVRALAYVNTLCYTAMFFTNVFACTPRAKIVDPTVSGKCISQNNLIVVSSTVNVASDVLILLFAVWGISRLQLSGRRQTMVAVVFSIGSFACIASVCRLAFGVQVDKNRNYTQTIWPVHMWSLAEITAIMYMACCPAFPRLIQYIRGTKTVKPAIRGFKTEKDLFSPTSSFSSSKPNTPEQKHGWASPIITPPTPPKGSPKITLPTPPNGSPTLPAGFISPQKPTQASVRVTPGPAQGSRGTQSEDRPRGPFRTLSLPVKPSIPRTSFQLPATRLEPKGPRLNFSIPVRPTPEQLANQSSLSPRYVPEERTAAIAKKAEGALQNYAPFERRISHLSYTSRHTAALEEIRQSLEEVRHSLDGGFIDSTPTPTSSKLNVPHTPRSTSTSTPKTPTTPGPHARSPSLAPPASPGMPSPASPARTEFSVHLVESAVRMKIMPVYFAQRRKKSQDMRASIASLGNQSIKPMHSFKRSKHARVPSTPGLQTHFEIP